MDSLFCHGEITTQQFFALLFGQGRAVLVYPLTVETSKAAIARRPITGRTDVWLTAFWPVFAKLDNGHFTVVGSRVEGLGFDGSRVDVGLFLPFS